MEDTSKPNWTFEQIAADTQRRIIEANGRLYTQEEIINIIDEERRKMKKNEN